MMCSLYNVPAEWRNVKLKEVATIIMGQSPPSSTYNETGEGLPFLQGKAEFGLIYPKPQKYTTKPLKVAEKGDILIAVRAPVGDVNIAPYKIAIGRGLAAIRPRTNKIDTFYLFYHLQFIKPYLENLGKGSTFKAITKRDLENLTIILPPLGEQRKIARILYTVDEAIAKTDIIISRVEKLRQALLDYLMTHGIGHKEYKETEIGKIPKEWRVVTLHEVVQVVKKSIDPRKFPEEYFELYSIPAYHERGVPELRKGAEIGSNKYIVEPLMVLFGRINPHIPKIWIVEGLTSYRKVASTEFIPLKPKPNVVDPYFLYYLLWSRFILAKVPSMTTGSTQSRKRISDKVLLSLKVPLPSVKEQKEIAKMMLYLDRILSVEKNKAGKLRMLKEQLMNLLLTGKVRVKDLPID